MSIVTSLTTVSHRYYVKRSKDEIIRRIEEMRGVLNLPQYTHDERQTLRSLSADQLAYKAMQHHAMFPA